MSACGAGSGASDPRPSSTALGGLSAAVRAVSVERGFVLAAVDAVQRGATAIDDTDQACVSGDGIAARTALRTAQPLMQRARESLASLARRVAAYQQALTALEVAGAVLDGAQAAAVTDVVRGGRAEALAVVRFRSSVAPQWGEYDRLAQQQDTWVTRAVAPWYRTEAEAASAYAVLVDSSRVSLQAARSALGAAAAAVRGPSDAQSATLAAADRALAGLRTSA